MSQSQRRLGELVKIDPVQWQHVAPGVKRGAFWVVAISGSKVVWFHPIEDGFNRSQWSVPGVIGEYWFHQDDLQCTVEFILDELRDGIPSGGRCGLPEPMP